jgi:electron transport complex protein RnfG
MKKILIAFLLMLTMTAQADIATPHSDQRSENVMTKTQDGTYIVNTTTLADDVEGYAGATPLEVHIKKNKIVKVVVLKNMDGPKYNAKVKKEMLTKYEGMDVKKGKVQEVDAVTGATFTSKAMQENIRRAVDYYKKHK